MRGPLTTEALGWRPARPTIPSVPVFNEVGMKPQLFLRIAPLKLHYVVLGTKRERASLIVFFFMSKQI